MSSESTNATPKPLSEKRIEQLRELYRPGSHYRSGDIEGLLAYIDALKAQPPPVPLAEDEAVIEDLLELAESNYVYICDPEFKHRDMGIEDTLRAVVERLSLRSRQLARVLALKGGPSCNQCIRMVVHIDEIRAIAEGEK